MNTPRLMGAECLEDRRMLAGDNPVVTLQTNAGNITMELLLDEAPQTVENFLQYAADGDYANSIFHRLAYLGGGVPFVLQGGGFTSSSETLCQLPCDQPDSIDAAMFDSVTTNLPVQNEFGTSNTRGTVAMAKLGGNPDSATSQYFFNLGDNAANLDNQNGGFTVFARVDNMTVVDEIAAFQRRNAQSVNSAFSDLPFFEDGNVNKVVRINSVSGTSVIAGNVFNDLNGNGSLGLGEGGLRATVFVDSNNNGTLDDKEPMTVTNDVGEFRFGVDPGTHSVLVVPFHSDYRLTTSTTVTVTGLEYKSNFNIGFEYTGSEWTNPLNAFDVDGINGVTPTDAILVINELSNRQLSDPDTGALPSAGQTGPGFSFVDVDDNDIVSPADAIIVINRLNSNNRTPQASSNIQVQSSSIDAGRSLGESTNDDEDETSALDKFFSTLGTA